VQRLTASMLKPVRLKLKREQQGLCPLCGLPLDKDIVLDHDHATGDVRAVLHRWCNSVLGRVENWSGRIGHGVNPHTFLTNTLAYLQTHKANPSGLKYPTFKTEAEKRERRNARARAARRKAKEAH